jgi:hypothetical protein
LRGDHQRCLFDQMPDPIRGLIGCFEICFWHQDQELVPAVEQEGVSNPS